MVSDDEVNYKYRSVFDRLMVFPKWSPDFFSVPLINIFSEGEKNVVGKAINVTFGFLYFLRSKKRSK